MPRMRQMKMYLSIRYALHTIIRESINIVDKLRRLYHILTSFQAKNKCCEDTICISTTFIIEPKFSVGGVRRSTPETTSKIKGFEDSLKIVCGEKRILTAYLTA